MNARAAKLAEMSEEVSRREQAAYHSHRGAPPHSLHNHIGKVYIYWDKFNVNAGVLNSFQNLTVAIKPNINHISTSWIFPMIYKLATAIPELCSGVNRDTSTDFMTNFNDSVWV